MLAVVDIGAFFLVPQTHGKGVVSALRNKRDFVLEPLLLLQHGNDLPFQLLGKLRGAVGLQFHGNAACIHIVLLGCDD